MVPSQSNQILNTTLKQFISQIKVWRHLHALCIERWRNVIQEPDGSTDGADKCPGNDSCSQSDTLVSLIHPQTVYSVSPTSPLSYTIQRPLASTPSCISFSSFVYPCIYFSHNAANSHRLFVTTEASAVLSPASTPSSSGNLSGIVSIVDSTYPSHNPY